MYVHLGVYNPCNNLICIQWTVKMETKTLSVKVEDENKNSRLKCWNEFIIQDNILHLDFIKVNESGRSVITVVV